MPQLPEALNFNYVEADRPIGNNTLPTLREWAFDFDTGQFKLDSNGLPYLVDKNEALKIWIYWAIITERNQWRANSRTYGSRIEKMIGLPMSDAIKISELERTIKEALEPCQYIKSIKDIKIDVDGDMVSVNVLVESIYTERWVDLNVKI